MYKYAALNTVVLYLCVGKQSVAKSTVEKFFCDIRSTIQKIFASTYEFGVVNFNYCIETVPMLPRLYVYIRIGYV